VPDSATSTARVQVCPEWYSKRTVGNANAVPGADDVPLPVPVDVVLQGGGRSVDLSASALRRRLLPVFQPPVSAGAAQLGSQGIGSPHRNGYRDNDQPARVGACRCADGPDSLGQLVFHHVGIARS
jgi:hypothetical protein